LTKTSKGVTVDEVRGVAAGTPPQLVVVHSSRHLVRDALADLSALRRFGPLVRELASSSLRTENVGTLLGSLWWLIHPLMLVAAYVILIDVMLRASVPFYPLFILTSVLAWKFFQSGIRNAVTSTLAKEEQMRQIAFPKAVLPLSAILAEAVRFAFALVVLVIAAACWGRYPSVFTPLLVLVAAVQFVLTLAFAIFLSAVNFFVRDVRNFIDYGFPIWFYLSPGLYTLASVPAHYRTLYLINPLATILPAYHRILIDRHAPNFLHLGIVFSASLALLVAAYLFFVQVQSAFAKVN
jgi:homopolymeric O-antigen transport system permease protein